MTWLVLTSLRRNLGQHWLAVTGLACAVAVSCLGLSGAGLMMRVVRRPVTQIMGGDLMVMDARLAFFGNGASVRSEGGFPLFRLSEVTEAAGKCLPGTPLTATLLVPCLNAGGRGVGFLVGRLDDTHDPMYMPDILRGDCPQSGSSPIGIMLPGNPSGSKIGSLGSDIILRVATYKGGLGGDMWDIAASRPTTFRVAGVHDETWARRYLFVQLKDLYTLLGINNLVSWAALAYKDPWGLDNAAATLRESLAHSGQTLQVMTADDFARIMSVDFERFRRTASFYSSTIVLISILVVVASSLFNLHSRRRELALLRAIGLATGQVRRLFLWESALVSALGAGIGYLMSGVVAGLLFRSVFTAPLPALAAVAATMLVSGMSSGFLAITGVADALRNP